MSAASVALFVLAVAFGALGFFAIAAGVWKLVSSSARLKDTGARVVPPEPNACPECGAFHDPYPKCPLVGRGARRGGS